MGTNDRHELNAYLLYGLGLIAKSTIERRISKTDHWYVRRKAPGSISLVSIRHMITCSW